MNKISRRRFIGYSSAIVSLGGVASFGVLNHKDPFQKMEDLLESSLHDLPAATISAAVIKGGELYWEKSVGYQNLEQRVPADFDSIWPSLGSVSKLVTWAALMQLIEKGLVDMNTDVSRYLGFSLRNPDFPADPITPYHLFTHTSSLSSRRLTSTPDKMSDLFCKKYALGASDWVRTHLSPTGSEYKPDVAFDSYRPGGMEKITPDPIGVIAGYSNLNAMVAATIIENVTQLSMEEYSKKNIFDRIGIKDIGFDKNVMNQEKILSSYEAIDAPRFPTVAAISKKMMTKQYISSGIINAQDGERYFPINGCEYYSPFNSAGLLGSSTAAITSFLQALLPNHATSKKILDKKTSEEIWKVRRHDPLTMSTLGLGWFKFNVPNNGIFWGHDGGGPGILSRVMINPETGDGVVLLINNFYVDFGLRAKLINRLCGLLDVS